METICHKFNFDFGTYVDPKGLTLWWKAEVDVIIKNASKNIIHTIVSENGNPTTWVASFVYGSPCREGRDQLWEDLGNIGHSEHLPWLCMGDFNEVLRTNDKFEGNIPSQRRLSSFHRMLNSCGLVDLGFQGPRFTWRNNRAGEDHIMERIDMAFANSKWR